MIGVRTPNLRKYAKQLAKQYEQVLTFIENKKLDDWTHKKAIELQMSKRLILKGLK